MVAKLIERRVQVRTSSRGCLDPGVSKCCITGVLNKVWLGTTGRGPVPVFIYVCAFHSAMYSILNLFKFTV